MNIKSLADTNRPAFNEARKFMQKRVRAMPKELVRMSQEEIDAKPRRGIAPVEVWQSREFLVQIYDDKMPDGSFKIRLSINRCELQNDGHWKGDITWQELMRCKAECGRGVYWAVECYPPDEHVVNVANIRHLWVTERPPFGWLKTP